MYILLEYAICVGLTLVVAIFLFALCLALLLAQEGCLQLGSFVRTKLYRPHQPALKFATGRTVPAVALARSDYFEPRN